jgi:hypothetical protein
MEFCLGIEGQDPHHFQKPRLSSHLVLLPDDYLHDHFVAVDGKCCQDQSP